MYGGFSGGQRHGGGGGAAGGIEQMLKDVPPVTRAFGGSICVVTLLITLDMLKAEHLFMYWPLVVQRLHVWRIVTDFLYVGSFGINWIFRMFFFMSYSSRLEAHRAFSPSVAGNGAYLFFIASQMVTLHLVGLVFSYPGGKQFLGGSLMFSIVYYWATREPYVPVSLWGIPVSGWQLPYALLVLDILMGANFWQDVMGLATAHLYHFIRDVLPVEKNVNLLPRTPQIFGTLTSWMDPYCAAAPAPATRRQPTPTATTTTTSNFATLHGGSSSGSAGAGSGTGGSRAETTAAGNAAGTTASGHYFPGVGRRLND